MRIKIGSLLGITLFLLYLMSCTPESDRDLTAYIKSIRKIDIHAHMGSDAPWFRDVLDSINQKILTICTGGTNPVRMYRSMDTAKQLVEKNPRYYAWVTTFDLTGRDDPHWAENVINQLGEDFRLGAVGVKVWKDIGMKIKNKDGDYIQIDDPMFEPILRFISDEDKTLIAHLGEPIDAWMPPNIESKPQFYWSNHPEYHFWDKPDKPSYSDIMAARDHVLERHPDLRFVGAHLGSMSYDVNEVIKRLDRYPNFAVEIGGRTRYLMWQARGKVRSFFIQYQDRIMYGTDQSAGIFDNEGSPLSEEQINGMKRAYLRRHDFFMRYYATDEIFPWANNIRGGKPVPETEYTVQGLALPEEVLEKVYYQNAVNWFPGIDKEYK
ncbi:MAG: amidohydrolase family protein [Bacteroidales bacterium]